MNVFLLYCKKSPLENERGLSFEEIWIPFTQRCFVPSLVKIDPVVLEKKIFDIVNVFCYFVIIFEKGGALHLNPLHPRMHCTKIGWNWPSGSGKEGENVKSLRQRWQRRQRQRQQLRTTDKVWSEELTWAFGSGELIKSHVKEGILRPASPYKVCASVEIETKFFKQFKQCQNGHTLLL